MTYRVPEHQLLYDVDTTTWIVECSELPITAYDNFPQAALSRFYMMFQNMCHDPNRAEELKKLEI